MHAHEVQIHIFLQREEIPGDAIGFGLDAFHGRLVGEVGGLQLLLDGSDRPPQLRHLREGEVLDLVQLGVHLGEEGLLGHLEVARAWQPPGIGRGRRGDGYGAGRLIDAVVGMSR